jgi:ABC-type transporter Mla MlaB component
MTTRKNQTPVKKRARSRTAQRDAGGHRTAVARGKTVAAKAAASRVHAGSLVLSAECTIAEAEALKTELAGRLQEAAPVTLDVSALQRIDTAGLQLLAAFVRDRRTAGRAIAWRGQASALETAAGLLGLRDMLELPGETAR